MSESGWRIAHANPRIDCLYRTWMRWALRVRSRSPYSRSLANPCCRSRRDMDGGWMIFTWRAVRSNGVLEKYGEGRRAEYGSRKAGARCEALGATKVVSPGPA